MAEKKKLLFLHHYGKIGGAGVSGAKVLQAIPKDLYDVTVYCSTGAGTQMTDYFRDLGFRVLDGGDSPQIYAYYSGAEKLLVSRRALKTLLLVEKDKPVIRALLEREKPDVVAVNSMCLFWIGRLAKEAGAKTVCFFRETYAKEWTGIRNRIIRRALSGDFDAVAFISEHDLEQNADLKCEKHVIYDSVDTDYYASLKRSVCREKLGFEEGKKYALYVGGMSKLKGADLALSAMLKLDRPDTALCFIDGGALTQRPAAEGIMGKLRALAFEPWRKKCEEMYRALKEQNRILVFPAQEDIAPFYAAADALLAPSTKPHQLRPIYEAGAAGIPVVTTRFQEVGEFANETTAFLAENGNAGDFARALELALDGAEAEKKTEANRRSVLAKNSDAAMKEKIERLFRSLADGEAGNR